MATTAFLRKMPERVLFLRPKHKRSRPSHSTKLMSGGGTLGSMDTTDESTLGGGRKLLRDTLIRCRTRASSCVLTDRRQYSSSPGRASSRSANSRWNMSTHVRGAGRIDKSRNTSGDEIAYGMFATHRSNGGSSTCSTSPTI